MHQHVLFKLMHAVQPNRVFAVSPSLHYSLQWSNTCFNGLLRAQALKVVAQSLALLFVLLAGALGHAVKVEGISGTDSGGGDSLLLASAALLFGLGARAAVGRGRLGLAVGGLFAHEGALGLLAVGRAVALPVAEGLFADTLALGGRVGALGVALRVLADGVALGAGALFAVLDRAAHFALGLLTLDCALAAAEFLAAGGALGLFADGFADLVADGGVALPLALGVAVVRLFLGASLGSCEARGLASSHKEGKADDGEGLHGRSGLRFPEI